MTDFGISPDDLRRLARLVEENGLSELRYEEGDLRVTLRTASYRPAAPAAAHVVLPAAAGLAGDDWAAAEDVAAAGGAAEQSAALGGAAAEGLIRVEAPVMGVFYRSPAPGEPAFVEVGDDVEVGQPIGIIEAMKVFSEVLSEAAGRVAAIPVGNGALVHPGDALVLLEEVS